MTIKQLSLAFLLIANSSHFISASQKLSNNSNFSRIYRAKRDSDTQSSVATDNWLYLQKFPDREGEFISDALPAPEKKDYEQFKNRCLFVMLRNCEKQIQNSMRNGDFRDCTDLKKLEQSFLNEKNEVYCRIESTEKKVHTELTEFIQSLK